MTRRRGEPYFVTRELLLPVMQMGYGGRLTLATLQDIHHPRLAKPSRPLRYSVVAFFRCRGSWNNPHGRWANIPLWCSHAPGEHSIPRNDADLKISALSPRQLRCHSTSPSSLCGYPSPSMLRSELTPYISLLPSCHQWLGHH